MKPDSLIRWNFTVNNEEKGIGCSVALGYQARPPGSTSSRFHGCSAVRNRAQRTVFSHQHAIGRRGRLPPFLCGGEGEQWESSVHLLTQQRRKRRPAGAFVARRPASLCTSTSTTQLRSGSFPQFQMKHLCWMKTRSLKAVYRRVQVKGQVGARARGEAPESLSQECTSSGGHWWRSVGRWRTSWMA